MLGKWNPSGCTGSWADEEGGGADEDHSSSEDGEAIATAAVRTYSCSCNHLTHFAVLFRPDKAADASVHTLVLTNLTYVGTGISLLCLFATFFTYLYLSNLRETPQEILMHLTLALALFQIFFLFVSPSTHVKDSLGNAGGTCKATAVLMHYTTRPRCTSTANASSLHDARAR